MKRSCKNIDLRDAETLTPWVAQCVYKHRKKSKFRRLLTSVGGINQTEYNQLIHLNSVDALAPAIDKIASHAAEIISSRELNQRQITYARRVDKSSGKVRLIGSQSAMQQVLDAIAVGASEEIFARRIVPQQSSSIPGRGQIYGMNMIKGWALKDARAQRYAKKHQIRYTPKTKYWAKADITKCYQSLRVPVFMRLFERDCANKDLVWLWQALLESHIQDGQKGFMIGSLVSQYAAQYIFSFAYRYITSLTFTRRGKRLRKVEHCLFYMDDILMTGRSKNQLASAVKSLTRYCKEEFGITVKPSWMIYRTDVTPMDMMGFRIHSNGKVTLRATIHKRQRRSYLRCRNRSPALSQCRRLMSFRGWIKHSNLTGYKSKTVLKVKSLCNQIISKEAINANRAHNRARAGVVHATA